MLDRYNIKFKLGEDGEVEDIDSLETLKIAIQNNPEDIYLIDSEKIIQKNALSSKIKFLTPKGGIEQEFLEEHGVGDISVDSLEDLPKHINKRLKALNLEESFIEEETKRQEYEDIQESISEIVEEAYTKEIDDEIKKKPEEPEEKEDIETFETIDDELSGLLSSDIVGFDLEEENKEVRKDNMPDEFSELNSLQEDDLMAALDGIEDIDISSVIQTPPQMKVKQPAVSGNEICVSSADINEFSALIAKLLNNKTLEITIKIKD
jgi:hypothetical protein